ncbi:MAG: heavy metal-associated domain-containing protein, partial [Usitatibacteraceae bacterium]
MAAETLSLQVTGMTCASCVSRVEKSLAGLPGIDAATVNLATETATLRSTAPIDVAKVVTAIDQAGYGVAEQTIDLAIGGMTCASCVGRVEQA